MSSIQITYHLNSDTSKEVVEAIRVEQTIEFPFDLAPEWIQKQVVGQVVSSKEIGKTVINKKNHFSVTNLLIPAIML